MTCGPYRDVMSRRILSLLPALVVATLLAPPARAQADTPPPPAASTSASVRPLERLRESLALLPHQLPHWHAYVNQLDAWTHLHYREKPVPADASATRQFARLVDLQQNRLAALEDIERAVITLYASLTPAQRTLADQQLYATLPVFASAATPGTTAGSARDTSRPAGPPPGGPRPPGGF